MCFIPLTDKKYRVLFNVFHPDSLSFYFFALATVLLIAMAIADAGAESFNLVHGERKQRQIRYFLRRQVQLLTVRARDMNAGVKQKVPLSKNVFDFVTQNRGRFSFLPGFCEKKIRHIAHSTGLQPDVFSPLVFSLETSETYLCLHGPSPG